MKKLGIIIFASALVIGVVLASVFSFGRFAVKSPVELVFGKKIKGSGNLETEKRDVSGFKSIDVGGVFKVEVVAQQDFDVEVEADDNLLPLIKTEVSGGTLKIEKEKRFSTKNHITIRISAPEIESISHSGASQVSLSNVENEKLMIDSSGASNITVSGTTKRLVLDISGASGVDAFGLSAEKVTVDGSGASNARVKVSEQLSVDLSGASRVKYKGSPSKISKDTSGASGISQVD